VSADSEVGFTHVTGGNRQLNPVEPGPIVVEAQRDVALGQFRDPVLLAELTEVLD
jgi:hypothetical protein